MKIMSSSYNFNEEECKIKTTTSYNEMDDVIKMDCLIDTIYELENLRDSLHEKMYGKEEDEECPDDLSRIKVWLKGEVSDVRKQCHEDDVDARELGILDGRLECAENLLEQIEKWENKE